MNHYSVWSRLRFGLFAWNIVLYFSRSNNIPPSTFWNINSTAVCESSENVSSIATSYRCYLKLLHCYSICSFKIPYLTNSQKSISGNIMLFFLNRQIFGQSSCFKSIFIHVCFYIQTEISVSSVNNRVILQP